MRQRGPAPRDPGRVPSLATVCALVFGIGLADSCPRLGTPAEELARESNGALAPVPAMSPERVATVCVDVVDSAGQPLLDARLHAYRERAQQYFEELPVPVGRAGKQTCLRDVAHGSLWLLAEAPGFARQSLRTEHRADQVLTLRLVPEARLSVRVVDEESRAITSATVLVEASDPLPFGKLSDARGDATFGRLPAAPWRVRVFAPGYEDLSEEQVAEDRTLTLRRLSSIDVRVVDAAGTGVSGAAVLIAGPTLWPARREETDTTGFVKLRGLAAGSYNLSANHGTLVSAPIIGHELQRGGSDSLVMMLEPGRMITALVSDGEAKNAPPVPGADVVLVEGGLGSFPLHGRTDQSGRVVLGPIGRGTQASLGARAPDFVGGQLVPVPAESQGPIRVPLMRGATVRGEVVDGRGSPVSQAEIEIVGTDRYGLPILETPRMASFRDQHFASALVGPRPLIPSGELGVLPGPVPPIPQGGLPAILAFPTARASALPVDPGATAWLSNKAGEFVARPVTPGRVRAIARHPDFVEGSSEVTNIASGATARVRIVLLAGGRLSGRVVDERGFPVSSVSVKLVAERGSFEASTRTSQDGSFAFRAVPANVAVSVVREDDATRVALRRVIEIPEGSHEQLELVLPERRPPVRVAIADERGAPVSLAEVRVASLDPASPLRTTLFTDAEGRAELADALGLSLRFSVEAPNLARVERDFERAPGEVSVVLSPGVLVSGLVTAVRGRRVVAGASITLRGHGQRWAALTDADGVFRVNGVPPGSVELVVRHPDYAEARQSIEVRRSIRADRPFELSSVDLAEGGALRGRVVDEHDRPVEGARVAVGVAPAYWPQGALPSGVAVSDRNGEYVLSGLAPGSVRIAAYLAGVGQGAVDEVTVLVGTNDAPTIRLNEKDRDTEPTASGGVAVTLALQGEDVQIAYVAEGSEAERGGLMTGDVLRSIDGQIPLSVSDARARLAGPAASDVLLVVERGARTLRVRVTREPVRR